MVVLHLQTSCDGCESFVVSNGVGLLAPVLKRLFKNAEGSCKSRASVFLSSVFFIFFSEGMAAPVAVLCAAWTWGPITSQGSVCSSSLFAEKNNEGISTATYMSLQQLEKTNTAAILPTAHSSIDPVFAQKSASVGTGLSKGCRAQKSVSVGSGLSKGCRDQKSVSVGTGLSKGCSEQKSVLVGTGLSKGCRDQKSDQ